jgi:predicted dehydrogenase
VIRPGPPEVLVIGAGSIGARHVRNLVRAGARVTSTDPDVGRAKATDAHRTVPFDLDRLDPYDGIVVASPTRHHLEQARLAVASGATVLVEKPLAEHGDGVEDLITAAGPRLMVGYNLRLHQPIETLVGAVHAGRIGRPLAARLWFGSWLPDWRPDVDYRTTYSARANLGGGVLNDAIHELDLAVWLCGPDLSVRAALVARVGPLEIEVEDTVRALLATPDGVPVTIELDYLSRRYRRGMEVVGTEATIRLDWARGVIELETGAEVTTWPADTPVDLSYEREAQAFLDLVAGVGHPPVDGAGGAASLYLAEAIRTAARRDDPER